MPVRRTLMHYNTRRHTTLKEPRRDEAAPCGAASKIVRLTDESSVTGIGYLPV